MFNQVHIIFVLLRHILYICTLLHYVGEKYALIITLFFFIIALMNKRKEKKPFGQRTKKTNRKKNLCLYEYSKCMKANAFVLFLLSRF